MFFHVHDGQGCRQAGHPRIRRGHEGLAEVVKGCFGNRDDAHLYRLIVGTEMRGLAKRPRCESPEWTPFEIDKDSFTVNKFQQKCSNSQSRSLVSTAGV